MMPELNHFHSFFSYFRSVWVDSSENRWYERSHPFATSNNQGMEAKNKCIKQSHTFRKRMALGPFINTCLRMVHEWALEDFSKSLPEYSGSGKDLLPEYTGLGPYPSPRVLWLRPKTLLPEYSAWVQNILPEFSGLSSKLPPRVLWLDPKTPSQSTLAWAQNILPEYSGLGPKLSPRVLWLRPKTFSQSTLAGAQNSLPEYSGLGPKLPPRVLWLGPKTPSQSTLGGGYKPLPEYSGRALQSEDYHLASRSSCLSWMPSPGKALTSSRSFARPKDPVTPPSYLKVINRWVECVGGVHKRLYGGVGWPQDFSVSPSPCGL